MQAFFRDWSQPARSSMYWGGIALLFFRNKFVDPSFMERVRPALQGFAQLNVGMQAFFRDWSSLEQGGAAAGSFVDYAEIEFLAEMNRNLLRDCDDDTLLAQLDRNLALARELKQEIMAETGRSGSRGRQLTSERSLRRDAARSVTSRVTGVAFESRPRLPTTRAPLTTRF